MIFAARIFLGFILWDLIIPRIGLRKLAIRTREERIRLSAIAFRSLAVELGGVLIKVGQFLSSRVDVLPRVFTDELMGLQDEVPPVDFEAIRSVAEGEFGCSLMEKYVSFDPTPLAAASLGQVHQARLQGCMEARFDHESEYEFTDVVVKIQRPQIEQIISTDLAALRTVGGWLKKYPPISKRANVPALLDEFARILYEEIDYLAEGRNAEIFAEHFKGDEGVRVPRVVWSHTTKRVLTLENVLAIKITDYEAITAAGIDRAEVASRLLDTYLKQIFEDGFFHADPHPGNLFVLPLEGRHDEDEGASPEWRLTFVDFGMVGRMPGNTKAGMREMLIGVGTRDSKRVIKSYQMLGVLLPGADLELLEKAGTRVFERFWGKNMTELVNITPEDIRQFANEFRELLYTMPFQVPQDFIFLARAVGILSGMCTGLDPDFNVWEHLEPYARKLVAEEMTSKRDFWINELKVYLGTLINYPTRVQKVLDKIEAGNLEVHAPEVQREVVRIELALRQFVAAIIFLAFFLGAIQVYLAGQWIVAGVIGTFAALSLLWLVFQVFKS